MKFRWLALCVLLNLAPSISYTQEKELPVEIVIEKLHHKDIRTLFKRSTEAVFKFYHNEVADNNCITNKCLLLKSKEGERTVIVANDPVLNASKKLRVFKIDPASESINIKMETYEDDKGEICNYDKGDNYYSVASLNVKLSDLNPGIFSEPLTLFSKDEKFSAVIKVRYGIPIPVPITQDQAEAINDVTKVVTLRSLVNLTNKTNLKYIWEYSIGDEKIWKILGATISESVVFYPIREIFKNPVKTNQKIQIRMKAASAEQESPPSSLFTIQFTPEAPTINNEDIKVTPTCPNQPSGHLNIKTANGIADKLAYYIIKEKTVEAGNFPDVIGPNSKINSGIITKGDSVSVSNLKEGDYNIVVYNGNMEVGKVFIARPFSISQYPVLTLKSFEVTEASCEAVPDGQIMIETSGGQPGRLVSHITPETGKRFMSEHTAIFSDLLPGTYSVTVWDKCSQMVTQKEVIVPKKAIQLHGKINIEAEPINEFLNGTVKITLAGGSGKYKYTLSLNNSGEEKQATANSWLIEHLIKGSYALKVTDISSPQCAYWDTTFVLAGKTMIPDPVVNSKNDIGSGKPNNSDNAQTTLPVNNVNNTNAPLFSKRDDKLTFFRVVHKTAESFASFKEQGTKDDYYIVIEKSKYLLSVYDAKDNLIITYPAVFGNDDQGDKIIESDRKTPEGEFKIISKREHAEWSKFMAINYPTEEDYKKFNERKKQGLIPQNARIGGNIGIHGTRPNEDVEIDRGNNWTLGCVSTKNIYIDQLYANIPVGTKVIIKK